MGVKSTRDLSRKEAEDKYVDLKMNLPKVARMIRAEAVVMSNTKLEKAVELLNDEANGGEGFENYIITGG